MERDLEADKLAQGVAFGIFPLACAVLGSWMFPLFRSAGDSTYQRYELPEILMGLAGGAVFGWVVGAILMYVRSKTETPADNH